MPEQYIDRPGQPFVQLKVKDLKPEHGEGFIGVGDVAVDANRTCRVLLDAPVFGADFRYVAPISIRRTQDAGYEVQMGGLPDESNFAARHGFRGGHWMSRGGGRWFGYADGIDDHPRGPSA